MTHPDFPDLADLNPEITLVPIAGLVPFHDAGLRVKRLKEPSSSTELVLVSVFLGSQVRRKVDRGMSRQRPDPTGHWRDKRWYDKPVENEYGETTVRPRWNSMWICSRGNVLSRDGLDGKGAMQERSDDPNVEWPGVYKAPAAHYQYYSRVGITCGHPAGVRTSFWRAPF